MSGGRKDFDQGYADGRSGESSEHSVMEILTGALVPGVDPVGSESASYRAGYEEGKNDRETDE